MLDGSTAYASWGMVINHTTFIYIYTIPGWWFGTFFIFHNICDNPSHWLIFFKMGKTTNQTMILTEKNEKSWHLSSRSRSQSLRYGPHWGRHSVRFQCLGDPRGFNQQKREGFSKKRWNHMEYVWCTVISLDFWHLWELITLKLDPSTLNVGLPIFGNFWKWWARIGFGFAYTYTLHFWTWPNMVRFYPQNVCVFHWKNGLGFWVGNFHGLYQAKWALSCNQRREFWQRHVQDGSGSCQPCRFGSTTGRGMMTI